MGFEYDIFGRYKNRHYFVFSFGVVGTEVVTIIGDCKIDSEMATK